MERSLDEGLSELVERSRRRDESAFAHLIRRHERIALAVAYSVLGNAADTGDVTFIERQSF